jgi:hypothetical protein
MRNEEFGLIFLIATKWLGFRKPTVFQDILQEFRQLAPHHVHFGTYAESRNAGGVSLSLSLFGYRGYRMLLPSFIVLSWLAVPSR